MVKGLKKEQLKGRNFALTIILGVFIAIMVDSGVVEMASS